eukprot:1147571-Pelagomonas_calceolata.AAC.9
MQGCWFSSSHSLTSDCMKKFSLSAVACHEDLMSHSFLEDLPAAGIPGLILPLWDCTQIHEGAQGN